VLMEYSDRANTLFDAQRLAAIVEVSDDAIISKTLEGRITTWNAGATRIFGYSALEMVGQSIERIIPPDLLHEEHAIIGRLMVGEYVSHYETTRITKDGRRIEISLSVSPLRDSAGAVVGATKIAREITERKQADEQRERLIEQLIVANARADAATNLLAENKRLMAIVLDALPDLVAYWSAGLKCRFANKAFIDWFGKQPGDIIGMALTEAFGESALQTVEPHIRAVLAGERRQFERPITTIDGKVRHTLTHYIPDIVQREVAGFVVRVSDITPLKKTEAALWAEIASGLRATELLQENRAALLEAQRVGQIGSWDWDVVTGALFWSVELYHMFELDPASEPLGFDKHSKYFLVDSWLRLQEQTIQTLRTGESYVLELQFLKPSGGRSWMEARGEAVRDESGKIVKLRGTTQDITRRKASDEQRDLLIEQLTAANKERALVANAPSPTPANGWGVP
jgi:PAS domain S-box-containing protein